MNDDYQNQLSENDEIQNNTNDKYSCLLSRMVYKHWQKEANMKVPLKGEEDEEEEEEKYIHPDAPLHRLSDIIRTKLSIDTNNDIFEEEEEEFIEEKLHPMAPRTLLSDRLIENYPQIFKNGYNSLINAQE